VALKLYEFAERIQATIYISPVCFCQAFEREIGDCERRDDGSIRDGLFERSEIGFVLARQITHKTAREAVARAGGVFDNSGGIGGQDK